MGVLCSDPIRDCEIVCKLAAREEDALRLLLCKHGGKVRAWLKKRFAGVLADQEVDAALNQAMFNVWQHIDSYDPRKATLGVWFVCIAQNAALDMVRLVTRQRHSAVEFDPTHDPFADRCVEASKWQESLLQDFDEEIKQLQPSQQRIIRADLDAPGGRAEAVSLSELFGIPKNHVYVYRTRAHATLRAEMQRRGYFQE